MTRALLVATLLLASSAGMLAAQAVPAPRFVRTDRFYWENDVGTTDQHYTNGLRYSTITSSTELWQNRSEHPVLRVLLLGADVCREESREDEPCHVLRTGWAVGQNFYTPEVITARRPDPRDRPYAGWLYYGRLFELSRGRWRHDIELDIGIIGPLSLSSSIQEGWHDLLGLDHPAGWDHQIARGVGLQAVYRPTYDLLRRRLDGKEPDPTAPAHFSITPVGHVSVGTPITSGSLGAMLRVGRGVPPAVVPRIGPVKILEGSANSAPATPPASGSVALRRDAYVARITASRPRNEPIRPFYAFIGGSLHGVLLNDFLQGTHLGATRDNPTISLEMKHGFAEWEAGVSVGLPFLPLLGAADLTVRRVWRGAEYVGGPSHQFWAFSATW